MMAKCDESVNRRLRFVLAKSFIDSFDENRIFLFYYNWRRKNEIITKYFS